MKIIKSNINSKAEVNKLRNETVLRNRNFLLLFSGRLVSSLGDFTFNFAMIWYILRSGGTSFQVGIMLMVALIPQVVLGPFAGVLADRMDRKKVLVSMDLIRGVLISLMGVLMYFNVMPFWLLCILLMLSGVCATFYSPTCSATISNIVKEEHYTKANSLDSMAINVSRILGPVLGGILFNYFGIINVIYINAASFIISGISQLFIKMSKSLKNYTATERNLKKELKEGFSYIKGKPGLYLLFRFYVVVNFFTVPIIQIYFPYTYNNLLHATTAQLSLTNLAFGIGFVIGSVASSLLPHKEKFHNRICNSFLISCSIVMGFAFPLFPGVIGKLPINIVVIYYSVLAFICGAFMMVGNIPITVIFQRDVEDRIRGRVFSLMNTFTNAAIPLGYFVAGCIVEVIPMYIIIFIMSIILVIINIFMMISKPIKDL